MKVKRLKEILEKLDEDFEIFVSPLEETEVIGKSFSKPLRTLSPSPFERYKVTVAVQAGSIGETGLLDLHLLLGFDDKVDYGKDLEDESAKKEFVN